MPRDTGGTFTPASSSVFPAVARTTIDPATFNTLTADIVAALNDLPGTLTTFTQSGTGAVERTMQDKARDTIDPVDFGAVNDGTTDDTAALTRAITSAKATGKTLLLRGAYAATTLSLHGSNTNPILVGGNAVINGIASTSTPALLDVAGYVTIDGQIGLYGAFNTKYDFGFWFHGDGTASANGQFSTFSGLAVAGFYGGYRIGDATYPAAAISEVQFFGAHTYGTPVTVQAEGTNTVVTFNGSVVLDSNLGVVNGGPGLGFFGATSSTSNTIAASGSKTFTVDTGLTIAAATKIEARASAAVHDYMLGTVTSYNSVTGSLVMAVTGAQGVGNSYSAWDVQPQMAAVLAIGAQVRVNGGEIQQAGQRSSAVQIRPLEPVLGNNAARWGIVSILNTNSDVVATMLSTINPSALTIDTTFHGTFSMDNVAGFTSQDVGSFINTSSDFVGDIFLRAGAMLAQSARSNYTVNAGSSSTLIWTDGSPLGVNFQDAYTGVNGGTIKKLQVAGGGTGAATLTNHGVLLGQGTSAVAATAVMTDGQLLVGQSSANPLPKTVSGDATLAASGSMAVTKTGGVSFGSFATGTDAANLTGSLAAARMPALTGDVTTSAGAVATTIAANAVTNAKAAQMAANTIKGNNTGSLANSSDLTVAQVQAMVLGQPYAYATINFNAATNTDTPITISLPTGMTRFCFQGFQIAGSSGSLTTATFGLFTASGGGGVAVIAGGTVITISTGADATNNNAQAYTLTNPNTECYVAANLATPNTIYFRLTNPQGSATTATGVVRYIPFP